MAIMTEEEIKEHLEREFPKLPIHPFGKIIKDILKGVEYGLWDSEYEYFKGVKRPLSGYIELFRLERFIPASVFPSWEPRSVEKNFYRAPVRTARKVFTGQVKKG